MKIDNSIIISALCAAYTAHTAAAVHVCGFNISGAVFAAEIPVNILLSEFVGISMTSDEIPCKRLRMKPLTKKTAALFQSFNPFYLCSFDELQNRAKSQFSGNCGIAFENMLCEFYQGTMSPPNLPFWQGGDFTTKDGVSVQAKFQNATIIAEKQLANIPK